MHLDNVYNFIIFLISNSDYKSYPKVFTPFNIYYASLKRCFLI